MYVCVQLVNGTRPAPPEALKIGVFQSRAAQLIQALIWHPDFKKILDLNKQRGNRTPTNLVFHKIQKARDYIIECLQFHFPRIRARCDRESRLVQQAIGTILRGVPGG